MRVNTSFGTLLLSAPLIMEQQQLNWAAYLQASIATDQAFVDTQMQKYKAYAAQKQMQLAAQTIQQLQQEINEQYEEWQAMQETLELLEQSHPNN